MRLVVITIYSLLRSDSDCTYKNENSYFVMLLVVTWDHVEFYVHQYIINHKMPWHEPVASARNTKKKAFKWQYKKGLSVKSCGHKIIAKKLSATPLVKNKKLKNFPCDTGNKYPLKNYRPPSLNLKNIPKKIIHLGHWTWTIPFA